MNVFVKLVECKQNGNLADSTEAQTLVKELQSYITDNYYTCTNKILAGLGQTYVADERFKTNIDKNGNGIAEFVSKAIEIYCRKQATAEAKSFSGFNLLIKRYGFSFTCGKCIRTGV